MRKRILEGIAGIGLLAVLPACSTQNKRLFRKMCMLWHVPCKTEQRRKQGPTSNRGKYPGMWKFPSYRSMPSLFITG